MPDDASASGSVLVRTHADLSLPQIRKAPPSDDEFTGDQSDARKRLKTFHMTATTVNDTSLSDVLELRTRLEREVVVLYDPDPELSLGSGNTSLSSSLYSLTKKATLLYPQFIAARHVYKDLGPTAADLVWVLWERFQSDLSPKPDSEGDCESHSEEPGPTHMTSADILSVVRRTIQIWAPSRPPHLCWDVQSGNLNVSRKFIKLCDLLNVLVDSGNQFRGVIVVKYRFTARVLMTMVKSIFKTVKPQVLLSSGCNDDPQSMDCLINRDILKGFEQGDINLLVVTSAAETCLELPAATCVIRWDPPDDYLAYAYSKAWLRRSGSVFVLMYEKDRRAHGRVMWHLKRMQLAWKTWMEENIDISCARTFPPPHDMLYNDHFDQIALQDSMDRDEAFISDPVTSVKVYSSDSVRMVYRYATRMGRLRGGVSDGEPLFDYESTETSEICRLHFSERSPLRTFSGPRCATRADARRLACFLACQELYRMRLLESTDWPTPERTRSSPFDDDLDEGMNNKAIILTTDDKRALFGKLKHLQWPRIRGGFWKRTLSAPPLCWFPTVFTLQGPPSDHHTCRPICIMTRLPLPSIPPFSIGPPGFIKTVHLRKGSAVGITEEELVAFHQFTTLLCRTVYCKPVTLSIENCACFFAPLLDSWSDTHSPEDENAPVYDMRNFIAWRETRRMADLMTSRPRLNVDSLAEDTNDALIQDNRGQYSPPYEVTGICVDLNPTSKLQGGGVEADYSNIMEYNNVVRPAESTYAFKKDQPLMSVSSTMAHRDYFQHTGRPKSVTKYVVPELCFRHPMNASLFRTAVAIPAVLIRIDDVMVAKKLNAILFENKIEDSMLADAITTTSAERGHDYERLELLGDTILKHIVGAYLLVYLPNGDDGPNRSKFMATERNRLVSNAMLLKIMRESGIPAYVRSDSILTGAGDRIAPGLQLARIPQPQASGPTRREGVAQADEAISSTSLFKPVDVSVGNEDELGHQADGFEHQFLGDKTVADVCEAILGAAWLSGGLELALKCLKRIGLPLGGIDRWSDLGKHCRIPSPPDNIRLAQSVTEEVQGIIGFRLARPELLAWALTHGSATVEVHTPHQWLEFVGDGLLDYMVVPNIYEAHPEFGPGLLTQCKSAMVCTEALAALCVESGIADHFVCGLDVISKVKAYTKGLRVARADEHKASTNEGRSPRQYWKGIKPPKELADCFESVLGAMLVSEGFDSRGCEIMYAKVMKPFYDKHVHMEELNGWAFSALRNVLVERRCRNVLVERSTRTASRRSGSSMHQCDIVVHGVVLASAAGPTRTSASELAEQLACEAVDADPDFIASNCDCPGGQTLLRKQRRAAQRTRQELEEAGFVEGLLGDLSSDAEDEDDEEEDEDDIDGVGILEETNDEDDGSEGEGDARGWDEGADEGAGSDMDMSD